MTSKARSLNTGVDDLKKTPSVVEEKVVDDIHLLGITINRSIANIFFVMGVVFGQVGQNVSLPIYINSLGPGANPYFVVLTGSIYFAIVFGGITVGLMLFTNQIGEVEKSFPHLLMFLIGACNGVSGILIVFSSPPTRTLPFFQAILQNSIIPFTFVASFFILRKKTNLKQGCAAFLVIIGLFMCLYTQIFDPQGNEPHTTAFSRIFWPMMFMLGFAPAAVMNVIEEKVLKSDDSGGADAFQRINMFYVLFWTSFYQVITLICLFWAAIIPGFGVVDGIGNLMASMGSNLDCFFNVGGMCPRAGGNGFLFYTLYVVSYIFTALLLRFASANYNVVATTLITPLGALFWTLFQLGARLAWSPNWDLTSTLSAFAMPVMMGGVVWYHKLEHEQHAAAAKEAAREVEPLLP